MIVKFFATYRQVTGCNQTEIEAPANVLALLGELSARWPAFRPFLLDASGKGLGPDAIVMVNGRHIEHLDGVATPLTNDDRVAVTPLVAGG